MSVERLIKVQEFVARLLPGVTIGEVSSLSGGYWNEVLRLTTNHGQMVLKHYREMMPGTLFPNLPEMEAAALDRLVGHDVAPAPIGYWPQERVLIYEYVLGALWSSDPSAVAALLRRKEAADTKDFRNVPMTMADILVQGDGLIATCHRDEIVIRLLACRPRLSKRQHYCACRLSISILGLLGCRLIKSEPPAYLRKLCHCEIIEGTAVVSCGDVPELFEFV